MTTKPKISDLAAAQEAAATATEKHGEAIKAVNDAMNASLDPFTNVISAANADAEAKRKLAELTGTVATKQEAYNKALRDLGSDSPDTKRAAEELAQAQRDLDEAQGKAFKSALDLEQAINLLGGKLHDSPELYKQNIDKINAMEQAHQISAETAKRMRDRLIEVAIAAGAIPGNAGTIVWADTDDAKRKLEEIRGIIRDLLGLDNTLNGTYGRGLGIQVSKAPTPGGSAIGGRVGAGDARLVGELGPELFLPDTAGTIVTARETASMLGGGGGGSTNVTYAINVNVDPTADKATVGKSVVEAIKLYELRSGSGWRS